MIEIEDVTVFYGRTMALDHVNLTLGAGITGLFGQNASGKSTLLRVLAGLLRPTSGSLSWDGAPLGAGGEEQRALIGYAGHDSGLYRNLSIEENLALFARLYSVPAARTGAIADSLGLGRFRRTPVGELSAGLRRRAGVARALLHEPELLLLDEPYAHLDDEAAEDVSSAVLAWRRPGRTAVIATHGARRIRSFTDSRIVLQRGQVTSRLDPEAAGARAPT